MAVGAPGPMKAPAVQLVEGEDKRGQGPATVRHLLVGELPVLGLQPSSLSAALSVVVIGYPLTLSEFS